MGGAGGGGGDVIGEENSYCIHPLPKKYGSSYVTCWNGFPLECGNTVRAEPVLLDPIEGVNLSRPLPNLETCLQQPPPPRRPHPSLETSHRCIARG